MSFFKNIFKSQKETEQITYEDFWEWFQSNEKDFFKTINGNKNIEKNFFNPLSSKLELIKDGYYFLTGMYNENTAELIITADGNIKNIVFTEEIINASPKLDNWKFTALKPPHDIENIGLKMNNYEFNKDNLSFYPIEHKEFPDAVEIVVTYKNFKEKDSDDIKSGTCLFLDNFLGELNFATSIDYLSIISEKEAEKELIPIAKLKDYLIWREKEFVEKYNSLRYNTENDNYSSLEATLKNGNPLIAIVNSTLLNWEDKPSHPWILSIEIKYDGSKNNGFPNQNTYALMNEYEDELLLQLKDSEGYLNIGRVTADNSREILFACKEFRMVSKIANTINKKYSNRLEIEYEIYKDKYWQSLEKYNAN